MAGFSEKNPVCPYDLTLARHLENFSTKNFLTKIFRQMILNGSIREKKHVSRNSKIFCPHDLTLARHLENFLTKKFFLSNDSK